MRHCGGGLVLLGLGVLWAKSGWKGFDATIGHFARFAPVSYAVYLFHFPLFTLAGAWFPDLHEAVRFLPVMVATLALAWIVERKLQPLVNMAADRFLLRKS
jgi:peptidoglycan/LPS O-acetylase OafA/YrhL